MSPPLTGSLRTLLSSESRGPRLRGGQRRSGGLVWWAGSVLVGLVRGPVGMAGREERGLPEGEVLGSMWLGEWVGGRRG